VELDDEICLCFHVTKRKILNFLRVQRPCRATQMSDCFSAGTGCGWCRRLLVRYFEAFVRGEQADDADFSPEQYAHSRARYIRDTGAQPPPGAAPLPDEPAAGAS
jgi:bacterioferritin-associated ferredoxin